MLTGSTVFGKDPPKDEDYLCVADDDDVRELIDDHWVFSGSLADDEEWFDNGIPSLLDGDFLSLSKGRLNLIVTAKESFAERWIKAHDHCVSNPPANKAGRVLVFRHYLYGEPIDGKKPKRVSLADAGILFGVEA